MQKFRIPYIPYRSLLLSTTVLNTTVLNDRISNPTMEEIGTTNPKYQPFRVLRRPFVRPRSKNHPLVPIHPFTRQIVPLYSV